MIADWIYSHILEPIITIIVAAVCIPWFITEYLKRR